MTLWLKGPFLCNTRQAKWLIYHSLIIFSYSLFWFKKTVIFFSRVHATLQLALSIHPSVGWSVTFYFFYDFFFSSTSLLLPKWSSDLKYSPCQPARDWCSRVSGLVFVTEYLENFNSLIIPMEFSSMRFHKTASFWRKMKCSTILFASLSGQ